MVIENRDQQYRKVAYHLLQSLSAENGIETTISLIGYFIALSKDGRLCKYMNLSESDYLPNETICLDAEHRIDILDVSRNVPSVNNLRNIAYTLSAIEDLDLATLFEVVISMGTAQSRRTIEEMSQPQELTHLVNSILNENHVHSVYNPFAGIGSYQLDNKEVDYYSQEINRNTWLIGKLRMYINSISCEYTCEDSLLRWEGDNRKFDAVVATPPFMMRLTDEQQSFQYWEDLGLRHKTAESLYFSRSITSINEDGVIIGVVPMSFLFNSTPATLGLRQYMLDNGYIQEVIQLPSKMFSATAINTAIIVLSKRRNRYIRFIDASECFTQSNGLNTLDNERVDDLRKNSDSINARYISIAEILDQNCDLTPSRYLEEEEVLPEGFSLIQLKNGIATQVRGERAESDIDGICLNIGDLSADGLNCIIDINSLEVGRVRNNFRRITSPVLLLSKVRVLKPTYIEASESMPIYISPNVMALEVNTDKITIPYLAYELSLKSDKLHKGAVIPNFRSNDILDLKIKVPALSSQQDILSQERVMIASLIQESKKAKIKEFGLEEIIEAERQKYAAEIKVRKHDMMPYIREMSSIVQLIKHYTQCDNDESIGNIIQLISKQEIAIQSLNSLIEALSVDETYGVAEKLNIQSYFHNLEMQHIDSLGYKITKAIDGMSMMQGGLAEEPDEALIDPNNPLSSLKRVTDLLVNMAKSDMDNLVSNIIENAVHHGFTDKSRNDYVINILIGYDSKREMLRIDFSNNGKPLPDGLTTERYALRGEKAGATGKTGIGGYRVSSIVKHYGGEVELYSDPYNTYPVTISIYLPIFRDDE